MYVLYICIIGFEGLVKDSMKPKGYRLSEAFIKNYFQLNKKIIQFNRMNQVKFM